MAIGQIGPLTAMLEALATAVGAGMLLGGFSIGMAGVIVGWPREVLAARALTDGYAGGAFGAGLAFIDLVLRYGF